MGQSNLVIEYANMLHEHGGPSARPVIDFVRQHKSNKVLMRRIRVLNKTWQMKKRFSIVG